MNTSEYERIRVKLSDAQGVHKERTIFGWLIIYTSLKSKLSEKTLLVLLAWTACSRTLSL